MDETARQVSNDPPGSIALPAGWVAEVVTFLEMLEAVSARPERHTGRLSLVAMPVPTVEAYRDLFRRVGASWLWGSRLRLSDAALLAIIHDPAVEVHELIDGDGASIGMLELDYRKPKECELAFFGVVPSAVGTGAARFLMNRALERAWRHEPAIARLFVHTCTNDHPAALQFYVRSGFLPYARGVECYPDPRLMGVLGRSDAPQVPLIE